jgi:4-amino-4-deoxy-L-arabinose transferase-like glycosyltransferase
VVGNNYGYFRDELYLVAMSHHPAFGYVDVPPLVPWITRIPRLLSGNALWALHVIAALMCAMIILLTGLMARLLGGAGWVQALAALGSATALCCSRVARNTAMTSSINSGGRWPPPSFSFCCATTSLDGGSRSAW